jgi:hypothetical protein
MKGKDHLIDLGLDDRINITIDLGTYALGCGL